MSITDTRLPIYNTICTGLVDLEKKINAFDHSKYKLNRYTFKFRQVDVCGMFDLL